MEKQVKRKIIDFIQDGSYFFKKGQRAYYHQDLQGAKKNFERAIRFEPTQAIFQCQLAVVLADLGEFHQSNEMLTYILRELDENMAECHYLLAANYAYLGEFRKAEKSAKRYMKLDPDGEYKSELEDLLEMIYEELGMDEPSTKEEEEIISQLEEATQLMEEGQYFKAILLLQKLIAKHPSHWQAYNQMALAYFYSNQVEPALETLFEVLEKNEGNIQALCHLAIIYHYTGQVDESKKLIGMLENVHPIHEEQRLKLGITMNILQQYKLGFQWLYSLYRKGLEGTDMFYYWLTVSAVQLGKGHIAEKVWKRGLEVGDQERLQTLPDPFGPPQDPVLSKENIQQHGFDFSKALSHFQELKDSPSFRSALVHKLYESTLQEKFQILYVLSKLKDIEAEKTLEIYVDSKQEPILSRQFANAILLKEMEVDQHVQRSYELLLELESDQIVLDEPTFDTWYTLISNAEIKNIIAWKSAILYFILKEKSDQVTQQSVSDRCGVSVATLQKYNKKLKHILTLEENNKK